jgi:lysozyme family protein
MNDNFEQSLAFVLKSEGGFVNNPHDPGGMTNLGVTKDTWESWVGHEVDEATMRALGPADVTPLYRRNYWDRVVGDQLPAGVDYCVFDCAVNAGTSQAVKILQRALNVNADGIIGVQTIAAAQQREVSELIEQFCEERLHFLQSLSTWSTFGTGWQRRVEEVKQSALQLSQQ